MNILKYYLQSEYSNIIFIKVTREKGIIQNIEFIFDENNNFIHLGKKDGINIYSMESSSDDEVYDKLYINDVKLYKLKDNLTLF